MFRECLPPLGGLQFGLYKVVFGKQKFFNCCANHLFVFYKNTFPVLLKKPTCPGQEDSPVLFS